MKKLKLFPFYDNNFLETADEITDFLIKTSSYDCHRNINTVNIFKETNNTTVIVPTNRVRYLLKFFILLSFKNKLGNDKDVAFIPNIKTMNEVVDEFNDFAMLEILKGNDTITATHANSTKPAIDNSAKIAHINREDKNIIIYDILRRYKELPQENIGAIFSLAEDITMLLNDFYGYNVDIEGISNALAITGSVGSLTDDSSYVHDPRLSDLLNLICGYKGIEGQFELIVKVDAAYKGRLKDLNLIDGTLLMSGFVNDNIKPTSYLCTLFGLSADNFKLITGLVFKKYYGDKNIFIALINDVPPVQINFLNKLKNSAKNFTVILPYVYPDIKKDAHPGYSIYFDFISKLGADKDMDKIQIKENKTINEPRVAMSVSGHAKHSDILDRYKIKMDIANSLFCLESDNRESKDAKGNTAKWDNVRIVSGLTIQEEIENVCALIKKDLLEGIKPQEIIVVLMERSYAEPLYSAFIELEFDANFLVPLSAFNDKDVLYFYKALEMVNCNFSYKNIINFLYLRDDNRDIIDYIVHAKDELNILDSIDNLHNLIYHIKDSTSLSGDLKRIVTEKLENLKTHFYIDINMPLNFKEFLIYLNKLITFLFPSGCDNQFIIRTIRSMAYYDISLNSRNDIYEFKFNFREYFLLIAKFIKGYEITPMVHGAGITVMGKLEGRYSFAKSAYIMGLSEDYFPSKRPKDYLLTPKIKEKLGMPSFEKLELFQKSHFLSYMMLFDKVTFSYPINIDGKKRLKSPYLFFIEDKLTNCIAGNTDNARRTNELDGLNAINKYHVIKKTNIESLSPGAIVNYVKCGYKFYLDGIVKIKKPCWDFDEKYPMIYGNIMHEAIRKFLDSQIKPLVESGDAFKFSEQLDINKKIYLDKLREIISIDPAFNLLPYKYRENMNKVLELIFLKFLKNVSGKVENYGFNRLNTEFKKEREILFKNSDTLEVIKIRLNGRIDLILSRANAVNNTTNKKNAWIYDFKTGNIQESGFAEYAKNFANNNISGGDIKDANDYLSSIQLYTYAYMLSDNYDVLGGSYVFLGNNVTAQKTGYIRDIKCDVNGCTFNDTTRRLLKQIVFNENDLLPNMKNKNNCKYCDYMNICY